MYLNQLTQEISGYLPGSCIKTELFFPITNLIFKIYYLWIHVHNIKLCAVVGSDFKLVDRQLTCMKITASTSTVDSTP